MGRGCATRSLMTVGVLAAVTLGASAGCTSGSTPTAAATGHPAVSGATVPAAGAAPPSLSERGLASPGCSSATATESPLPAVGTAVVKTSGSPFGIVAAPGGRWAFAVTGGGPGLAGASSVEVLSLSAGTGTDGAPNVTTVRSVPLPTAPGAAGLPAGAGTPAGAAITPDGKYLVVAEGAGVVVLSAARAEAGAAGAVLGSLGAPSSAGRPGGALGGAIEVAVSPDSRFVFVTLEADAEAAVFNLAAALAHGFGAADYVGAVPLGQAPYSGRSAPPRALAARVARSAARSRWQSRPTAGSSS